MNNEVPYYSALLTNSAGDDKVKIEDGSEQAGVNENDGKTEKEHEVQKVDNKGTINKYLLYK